MCKLFSWEGSKAVPSYLSQSAHPASFLFTHCASPISMFDVSVLAFTVCWLPSLPFLETLECSEGKFVRSQADPDMPKRRLPTPKVPSSPGGARGE